MQLKLDNSKVYAIALEGGGAKGSYEVGVWQALEEAGIRYNAVSGTSVGALNGAMMAMRDLPRAIACWEDIRLSQIMALDQETEQDLSRLMNGQLELEDLQDLIPQAVDIIKDRGLDVAPLRAWVREITDVQAIKNSDVELFVSTVDLTDRRALEIKVNDLPEDEVCNMLLASAYHPSFRLEKLGGKLYADGGFVDTIPIHALVENGCKSLAFRRTGSPLASETNKRRDGFVAECEAMQLPCTQKILIDGAPFSESEHFSEFEHFLEENLKDGRLAFDGIFCVTDKLAVAVIKALRRMGQRVPEDVQVIGYDGLRAFGDQDYYCSTIIQPVEAMAETCVELVLGETNPNTPSLLCLPVRYAYGGTTKA